VIEVDAGTKFAGQEFEGVDADLEISLEEYGFVMMTSMEKEGEYYVIYKIDDNKYGHGHITEEEMDDLIKGKEWADEHTVRCCLSFVGATKEDWLKQRAVSKFSDLISCWGLENIMGTEYHPLGKDWAFERIGIGGDTYGTED
jgi:hypothetical protein